MNSKKADLLCNVPVRVHVLSLLGWLPQVGHMWPTQHQQKHSFFVFAPPLIYNSLILHIKSLTIQPSKELRSNLEWCMNLLCNSVYIQNTDVTSSLQTDSGYVGGWVWCGSESGATSQSADDSLLLQ